MTTKKARPKARPQPVKRFVYDEKFDLGMFTRRVDDDTTQLTLVLPDFAAAMQVYAVAYERVERAKRAKRVRDALARYRTPPEAKIEGNHD